MEGAGGRGPDSNYSNEYYAPLTLNTENFILNTFILGRAVVEDNQFKIAGILPEGAIDGLDNVFAVVVIQNIEGDSRRQVVSVKC